MAFKNWDIPEHLFSITPIDRTTVNNFIGRDSIVQKYSKLIRSKNFRIVFEGEIGTGKTSLGNYIRFTQENSFTTDMEIMSQAHWGSKEFLLALQSSIITTCRRHAEYNDLLKINLFKNILDRNSNIRISNYQGGLSSPVAGLSIGKTESISQPIHLDDQFLISELTDMIKEIKITISKNKSVNLADIRIIFQINNLDPGQIPFTDETITVFLNSIRDILTSAIDASFILNGATGLQSLIQKNVRRLYPALIFEKVDSLSKADLIEALNKRIANTGFKGSIPFSQDLIDLLYNSTNGNFRETLGLMETLAIYFDNEEPLIGNITTEDCFTYFLNEYENRVFKLVFRNNELTNKGKVINALSSEPNLNVSELSKKIDISQGNTSALLSDLEIEGVIVKNKNSAAVECILAPCYFLASIPFFKKHIFK